MTDDERGKVNLPRLGYDGDESIYFDRTRPSNDPLEVDDEGNPKHEECDPVEVCAEIEQERDQARGRVERLKARLTRTAQILIEEVGAHGPEDAESVAQRTVLQLADARDQLEKARSWGEELRAESLRILAMVDRERESHRKEVEGLNEEIAEALSKLASVAEKED